MVDATSNFTHLEVEVADWTAKLTKKICFWVKTGYGLTFESNIQESITFKSYFLHPRHKMGFWP